MKRWLYEPPLLAVKISICREETIAKQEAQVEPATSWPYKVTWVLNENITNMFRAETQDDWFFAKIDGGHTSIFLLRLTEEAQWVALKLECIANNGQPPWTWWKL